MVLVWAKKVRTGRDISHPLHPISLQQGGLKWLRPRLCIHKYSLYSAQ